MQHTHVWPKDGHPCLALSELQSTSSVQHVQTIHLLAPVTQAFAKWLELGLPYLLILLSIFVWQHFIGGRQ